MKYSRTLCAALVSACLTQGAFAAQTPASAEVPAALQERITVESDALKTKLSQLSPEAVARVSAAVDRDSLQTVFDDKSAQHALSKHYTEGMSCITCHDQTKNPSPDWMAKITRPAIGKACGDCHKVQADVRASRDTHDKLDCIACHMPNVTSPRDPKANNPMLSGEEAVRRSHLYKINTAADYKTTDENGNYRLDDRGYGAVDVMWSCGGASVTDYTVCEGKGCHNPKTSQLETGLQYSTQAQMADEIAKWQKPVREAVRAIDEGTLRIRKLLEVTALSADDKADVLMYADRAKAAADKLRADGSWGVHAPHRLKADAEAGLSALTRAERLLDKAQAK